MLHLIFRNSSVKQVLNIDSNRFITLVRQDMQEIRIQDLDQFQNSVQPLMNYLTKCCFPTYFEYSMGGNLRFYKEHLQQDFELKNKLYSLKNSRQQLRKSSHSDNDSEPEALRYVLKPPDTAPVVNTIAEEPELSFDDYSSIYQPELMLNINSKSLVQEAPKIALRDYNREIEDTRKNDRHLSKPSSWSPDLIDDPSPVRLLENLTVLTSNQKDMFENYTSSIQRETYARKKLDSKDKPSKENVEMRPVPDKTTEKKMSKNMSLQSQLNKKEQEKKSSEDTSIGGKKVMNTFGEKSTLKQELRSVEKKDKSVNQNRILIQDKSKERDEIINLVQDKMNSAEGKGKEEEQKKKPIHDIRQAKKESINKCKAVGCKPRQPNTLQRSEKYAKAGNKTVLKEKSSKQAKKEYINNPSPSPPNEIKLKMDLSEKSEKKTESSIRSLLLENDMRAAYYDTVRPQVKNTSPSAIDNHSVSNSPVYMFSMDTNRIFDDVDLFEGLEIACDKKLSEQTDNDEEFYPASPISELHFFKTPCSTRQNSLEIFEKIESECIDLDNIKKVSDIFIHVLYKYVCINTRIVYYALYCIAQFCISLKRHERKFFSWSKVVSLKFGYYRKEAFSNDQSHL